MLADRQLYEAHVIFVEYKPMFLSEVRLQIPQFLAAQYPDNLEECLLAAFREVANINLLPGALEA